MVRLISSDWLVSAAAARNSSASPVPGLIRGTQPPARLAIAAWLGDFVQQPTTMPWGNRSLLFRDPDGNLVNFFTPVTPAAAEKFAAR